MTDTPTPFPLAWPEHRPRTPAARRRNGAFRSNGKDVTVTEAMNRVDRQVTLLGGRYPMLSSNIETRLDGRPRSGMAQPADPGVCLYFSLRGKPYAMACDSFTTAAFNIAAVAAHIDAVRAIERYGVATAAESLQVFTALPPPAAVTPPPARPWWVVFGLMREHATAEAVQVLWRVKSKAAAADEAALLELNLARTAALAEIEAAP